MRKMIKTRFFSTVVLNINIFYLRLITVLQWRHPTKEMWNIDKTELFCQQDCKDNRILPKRYQTAVDLINNVQVSGGILSCSFSFCFTLISCLFPGWGVRSVSDWPLVTSLEFRIFGLFSGLSWIILVSWRGRSMLHPVAPGNSCREDYASSSTYPWDWGYGDLDPANKIRIRSAQVINTCTRVLLPSPKLRVVIWLKIRL